MPFIDRRPSLSFLFLPFLQVVQRLGPSSGLSSAVSSISPKNSFRELKAISLGLESFLPLVKGHTIKWYTDNQSVSRIVEVGSMKEDLQCLALLIFSMCLLNSITLEVEWIPRSANDRAESWIMIIGGSRGTISFWPRSNGVLTLWTALLITKILSCPVNSRFWCPGTEAVDAFSVSWAGENNWLVPPIFLIPRVLNHMFALGGHGTLVVPDWLSASFWPLIFTDQGLSPIFSDFFEIPMGTDVFVLGNYKNALFGSPNFRSGVLFLRFSYTGLTFTPFRLCKGFLCKLKVRADFSELFFV